ncbi:hypothetical protein EPUS_05841 [Endocarpon pusillum Z07020]|uniref:Uncharacterized protein n=1 Tax=Endocarpon pusillum (strain Z07020 / HMAS-L-300199) TaxID=1263415 RepID=U1GVQ3_ENDPU|nr:uncharacterized protein EPUS_05841 [Endocarpon pusillum Z07020]ERF76568.1 hypothetical protein EPUS_05841 [Endocarpon pusillum Z07020]
MYSYRDTYWVLYTPAEKRFDQFTNILEHQGAETQPSPSTNGINGTSGINGTNGTNGTNGVNGYPQAGKEPIAIIGMGLRLPGSSTDTSKLWDLLLAGKSGHCDTPPSRFNADALYHPDADRPGSINSMGGYFLTEDPRLFDNTFFGINNVEAKYMDLQQRKLLELDFESFENIGVSLQDLFGANECDSAIVAASNLIQSPDVRLGAGKAGILSPTSTCHTFDSSADGYGRAEGVGALYLKKLSKALAEGDPIRSIIRGIAVNSNAKTTGITVPSADGQEAPHGTGTPVGDPIEVEALSRVFCKRSGAAIKTGSVETNLGHSGAVSGMTSLFKLTLALEKGTMPGTIGIQNVNPSLALEARNLRIVTQPEAFRETYPRVGLNSFGYGGANAHVILESARAYLLAESQVVPVLQDDASTKTFLLPVFAHNIDSLRYRIQDLAVLVISPNQLGDLAYTLGCRRTHFSTRGFLLAREASFAVDLQIDKLVQLSGGSRGIPLPLSFVSTGKGSQWPRMGCELLDEFPNFSNQFVAWTLSFPNCNIAQNCARGVMADWDIMPDSVIGHSSGEIAAAVSAGHISADEGIVIAYYRGYVGSNSELPGAMITVGLSCEDGVQKLFEHHFENVLRIACVNSPQSITVSGDANAIEGFLAALQQEGIFTRKLRTDNKAYNSSHMSFLGDEYERLLSTAGIGSRSSPYRPDSSVSMVSTVTEGEASAKSTNRARYWRTNLESPVLFLGAMTRLLSRHPHHIIEIGPHSTLELPIKQIRAQLTANDLPGSYLSALSRAKNPVTTLLHMAGQLYLHNLKIHFDKINQLNSTDLEKEKQFQVLVDLPKYRWAYGPLSCFEPRASSDMRNRRYPRHDLLGSIMPGGPPQCPTWRNVLRLEDSPWLQDHKLGDSIVFPAAGYLTMAMEALAQTNPLDHSTPSVSDGVEVFTRLDVKGRYAMTTSSQWWDFEISSFNNNRSFIHATGTIGIIPTPTKRKSRFRTDCPMRPQPVRVWYDKLAREGNVFGPCFQSLKEIKNNQLQKLPQTLSTTAFQNGGREGKLRQSSYLIHPITLDALLQTDAIAQARGLLENYRSQAPVAIGNMQLYPSNLPPAGEPCTIRAVVENTSIAATNAQIEMLSSASQPQLLMDEVRLVLVPGFKALASTSPEDRRQPMLRVCWRPDITKQTFSSTQFTAYLESFAGFISESLQLPSIEVGRLSGGLDLVTHKYPSMRILEIGDGDNAITKSILSFQTFDGLSKFKSYTQALIDQHGNLQGREIQNSIEDEDSNRRKMLETSKFDTVLLKKRIVKADMSNILSWVSSYLATEGYLVFNGSEDVATMLPSDPFRTVSSPSNGSGCATVVARALSPNESAAITMTDIIIVERGDEASLNSRLAMHLSQAFNGAVRVQRISFDKLDTHQIPQKSTVISTVEFNRPLLSQISADDLTRVKCITNNAANLLWITGGGTLKARDPFRSLVLGLARALSLEQPNLKFAVLDLDIQDPESDLQASCVNIGLVLREILQESHSDVEYLQHKGILFCSRVLPERFLNESFNKKEKLETVVTPLGQTGTCRLSLRAPGQLDTLHFVEQAKGTPNLEPGFLEIQVKCVGLNEKDIHALTGTIDTNNSTCALEFTGVVMGVGSSTSEFAEGDSVVVMASNNFSTFEKVPEWACCKLLEDEDLSTLSTVPQVYSSALYGLRDRAALQERETVLVHSAASGSGIAAIQVAKYLSAETFATVGSDSKRDFLVNQLGLKKDHIFDSNQSSFLDDLLDRTAGRGVDVVFNSLTGPLLHNSWKVCAEFGRFVVVGKQDALEFGHLDMENFRDCVTFSAFDLNSLYYSTNEVYHRKFQRLLQESLNLLREGKITPSAPLKLFDVSKVTEAYRYLQQSNHIGKVAISLENLECQIPVLSLKYQYQFDPEKSLSYGWLSRGHRPEAMELVEDLEQAGGEVTVIKGDVCQKTDVDNAVARIQEPVGGVIHAALGLDEALFAPMSGESWHASIRPKVWGTWHLHNALSTRESSLDFFLMTSSVSGTAATATESNYFAANAFQDAFARYRRSLGLKATALGIGMVSEVGYLHEHPEIEALLLRKGLRPLTEQELLRIIDMTLANQNKTELQCGETTTSRAISLPAWSPKVSSNCGNKASRWIITCYMIHAAAFLRMPLAVWRPIPLEGTAPLEALSDAVQEVLGHRLRHLLLLQPEQLGAQTGLSEFGMDSMLAAEFRMLLFHTLNIDLPFQTLLENGTTVAQLTQMVVERLSVSEKETAKIKD